MDVDVQGVCPQEFDPVVEAFQKNFSDELELGASFAVYAKGHEIINIYGGFADKKKQTPWLEDTITCIYSSGKAIVAYLVARAVSENRLDYDSPIAAIWPEFGSNGKEAITLAEVLSHQAGLPGIDAEMDPAIWLDWDILCARIADMKPMWELGSGSGYHPQTFGFIVGEVYRRAVGMSIGEAIRQYQVALYCGTPELEQARVAYMSKPPKAPDLGDVNEFTKVAFLKPWSSPSTVSRKDWMAAEMPASNMHGNANALAQLLHPIANRGVASDREHVISDDVLSDLYKERCFGQDLVLPFTLSWAAGMMRNINHHFGPNINALGQAGFGGSAVVVDPDEQVSIAYVMNKMSPYLVGDPRSIRLIESVYACL